MHNIKLFVTDGPRIRSGKPTLFINTLIGCLVTLEKWTKPIDRKRASVAGDGRSGDSRATRNRHAVAMRCECVHRDRPHSPCARWRLAAGSTLQSAGPSPWSSHTRRAGGSRRILPTGEGALHAAPTLAAASLLAEHTHTNRERMRQAEPSCITALAYERRECRRATEDRRARGGRRCPRRPSPPTSSDE